MGGDVGWYQCMHMPWTSKGSLSRTVFRYTRLAGDGELRYRYQCIWLPHKMQCFPDLEFNIMMLLVKGEFFLCV
jgi:hypothetical protein